MVRHTVVFKLKDSAQPPAIATFFSAANKLAVIPGVQKFECLRQISKHSAFQYGISMEFDTKELYDNYSNHPDHEKFVEEQWKTIVEDFLEIDYEPMA